MKYGIRITQKHWVTLDGGGTDETGTREEMEALAAVCRSELLPGQRCYYTYEVLPYTSDVLPVER